jgi:hypothetical protein
VKSRRAKASLEKGGSARRACAARTARAHEPPGGGGAGTGTRGLLCSGAQETARTADARAEEGCVGERKEGGRGGGWGSGFRDVSG